jgi:TolA-binding protein
MSLHELHPEELIDKAERGALDASEQAQLDRHLASCAVCRFEVNARDDFRVADRANEGAFSDDAIDMIVGASLRGADARRAKIREEIRIESQRPRALAAGRRWGVLLAVAVLLVSAQATARWLGIREPSWLAPPTTTTVTTTSGKNAAPAGDATKSPSTNAHSSGSNEKPSATISIPDQVPDQTQATTAPDLTPSNLPNLTVSATPSTSSATVRSTGSTGTRSVSAQTAIVPDPTASALFDKANSDRVQGKHMVATREYRELLENYPNAPEADLSRATLGRLLLDDGDATAALPLFDAYLQRAEPRAGVQSSDGALREETMVNRATALDRLHRGNEEADAWQSLLDAYPQSMHAERARERLRELDAH